MRPETAKTRQKLRIALVAPPMLPIPPLRYGGTERIVAVLANGLHRRGHEVTLFAAGDSNVEARLVPVVPQSLWRAGYVGDPQAFLERTTAAVLEDARRYDVIHSHIDWHGFEMARVSPTPVVTTLHGVVDVGQTAALLHDYPEVPLIAISHDQRSRAPDSNWLATIHHGLHFGGNVAGAGDGGYLLFVGRLASEKGVAEAIDVARASGLPLLIAAKSFEPREREIFAQFVEPAIRDGIVTFIGEVDGPRRDELFGRAHAALVLSTWPEPFGLVAIEALAAGTPVIATRSGALPEIVIQGVDGFVVDSVDEAVEAVDRVASLDRQHIFARTRLRFSAERMIDEYEAAFGRLLGTHENRLAHERSQAPDEAPARAV